MLLFEKVGVENTEKALELALSAAKERGLDVVLATTGGGTVPVALALAKKLGYEGKIVAVTHAFGSREKGKNILEPEKMQEFREAGVTVVTAAHALSGAERGLSKKFSGIYPVEIVANTLKMLGQGTKVCVEIAMMALDNGAIDYGKQIIAIGGSGRGADTVCRLTPEYTSDLMGTKSMRFCASPRWKVNLSLTPFGCKISNKMTGDLLFEEKQHLGDCGLSREAICDLASRKGSNLSFQEDLL